MKSKFKRKKLFIVYQMHCKANNKYYIGISNNFNNRILDHWKEARCGGQTVLNRTIRKYNKKSFVVSKIDSANTWEEVCQLEKYYIKKGKTKVPNGMNMTDGGEGVLGLKHSEKTLKQMQIKQQNREKQPFQNQKHTQKTKDKISKAHTGKRIGDLNPMFGKKCPEQSEWMKKNNPMYNPITLAKTVKANTGQKRTKGFCKSQSDKNSGQKNAMAKLTEEIVLEIRKLYDSGTDQPQLAKRFNVTQPNIHCIVKRKSWAHI